MDATIKEHETQDKRSICEMCKEEKTEQTKRCISCLEESILKNEKTMELESLDVAAYCAEMSKYLQ